jgi:tRNA nucleotidyltransferase (CCA-adding enzyme)
MKIYEVGGAVRDSLLGEPVTERDYVVIGATAADLLGEGYRQVGRDFPVFIHPTSGEEYALARTERKTGQGHTGFTFDTAQTISLESDLERRDLTVNAMARDERGNVIDPFHGQEDLAARVLRHVSSAFREDPLRVLRTARFAAKLKHLGFSIAPETLQLMRTIVTAGELETLRPERVWQETQKALATRRPDVYFVALRECDALARVYPEIDGLFGVPQPERWHPEIDTGLHTMMALRLSAEMSQDPAVRFAVLVHDLGKAATPRALWPRHHGHGDRSAQIIARLSERMPVPRRFHDLAEKVARHHGAAHRIAELKPATVLDLLTAVGGLRPSGEAIEAFLCACEADARGRKGLETNRYPQADLLRNARRAALAVTAATVQDGTLEGPKLGQAIRKARIDAIAALTAGS